MKEMVWRFGLRSLIVFVHAARRPGTDFKDSIRPGFPGSTLDFKANGSDFLGFPEG